MTNSCPACHCDQFSAIDSVPTSALVAGYRQRHLGVDIERLIPEQVSQVELLKCARCDLRWFWPQLAGDGPFYEQLQRNDWYYQTDKPEHRHAAAWVLPGQSVLEIGCGAGAFAARLPASSRYRGLEFNQAAVARAVGAGLDVTQRSVEEEAALRPAAYDVVCHFQVLEHVPDVAGFMQSCVDALRPGGKLLVAVPSEDSFLSIAGASWLNLPPHHVTRWTDRALASLFASLQMEEITFWHEPVAPFHADWYSSVMTEHALQRLLGGRTSLVGGRLAAKLAYRLGRFPALSQWLLARGELAFEFKGRGHTVCIMGQRMPG